jgi:hypothetical protein
MMITALAMASVLVGSNARLTNQFESQQSELESVAQAGLELGRAQINADGSLVPAAHYTVLANRAAVTDANGQAIPGLWRTLYLGLAGTTTGQYGLYSSLIAEAGDRGGNRVIRRVELTPESFAKFAYFTDSEGSGIAFGGGDFLTGPVHSNDDIQIYNSGATFQGEVTTAGQISGKSYGRFLAGYTENSANIPMPTTRTLNSLQALATSGGAAFTSSNGGTEGQARVRIEFVAVDLDGDGSRTGDDEGFFMVYRLDNDNGTSREWLAADLPNGSSSYLTSTSNHNCGYWQGSQFVRMDTMWSSARRSSALRQPTSRCLLGGDAALNDGGVFPASGADGTGVWQAYPGTVDPRLAAVEPARAPYMFPLSHSLNPNFNGVIYVQNKVALSGELRGRVTVVSNANIIIVDDLYYASNPAAGTCADMLGLFSGDDIVVADNMINSPQSLSGWRTYEELPADERLDAVVLALNTFHVEDYASGPTSGQSCGSTGWGRGCLALTGGVIQGTRGAVGTSAGTGYLKRYGYDACAAKESPPYFPTTGYYRKGGTFEIDPTGFSPTAYFP